MAQMQKKKMGPLEEGCSLTIYYDHPLSLKHLGVVRPPFISHAYMCRGGIYPSLYATPSLRN